MATAIARNIRSKRRSGSAQHNHRRASISCHTLTRQSVIEKRPEGTTKHSQFGEKPVTVEVIEGVLSRHIDDIEPRLMRHGYDVRAIVVQFHSKPAEIRMFLSGTLDADRTRELTDRMLAAGLPP